MLARSLVSGRAGYSEEFQIIAEQEFLPDDRNARDLAIGFGDEAFTALGNGTKDPAPILVVISERFPGIGIRQ